MISTIDFINILNQLDTSKSGYFSCFKVDFNLECFIEELSASTQFKIINNHSGIYSIVKEDYRVAIPFDFHNDGLFLENNFPALVILYCRNEGNGTNDTAFINKDTFFSVINENRELLNELYAVFVDRDGSEVKNNLLQKHKWTNEEFISIGSRVYIKPKIKTNPYGNPILSDITSLMHIIYKNVRLSNKVIHKWEKYDLVVFDNLSYLHARAGMEPDSDRELVRIWLDKK